MKTYEEYVQQANCISIGSLSVYNDLLSKDEKKIIFKKFNDYIFLFLANVDLSSFIKEHFNDFSAYFEIRLIEENISKKNTERTYNAYKLIYKTQ